LIWGRVGAFENLLRFFQKLFNKSSPYKFVEEWEIKKIWYKISLFKINNGRGGECKKAISTNKEK
jgi:hypothetical protein